MYMNKKLNMAVAGAVMAFGATAANAGIIIPAGDWTLDIGGNVNAYYTYSDTDEAAPIVGGLAGVAGTNDKQTNITTGLLPNYLSVSGKTRQNDLDVGFTISIQPGTSTNNALIQTGGGLDGGGNQENRQAFLTFGDKSWGTIKAGKDLGIFASDAILSDMTLLGVGAGAGFLSGNTTTLGGIGTGYLYADWKAQISYWSPNWNGFSFALGVMQPWQIIGGVADGSGVGPLGTNTSRSEPGFEGKVNYEWAGDVGGKVWASFITQEVEDMLTATGLESDRANGYDVGATVNVAGFALTGYYYDGEGIGTTGFLNLGYDATGDARDSKGGYVQAVYALPGIGTKLGVSYGISKLDDNSADAGLNLVEENKRWTVGAYHPLTKHLNLVAEYSKVEAESHLAGAADNESDTISAGAILFF
jgi:predicted porin